MAGRSLSQNLDTPVHKTRGTTAPMLHTALLKVLPLFELAVTLGILCFGTGLIGRMILVSRRLRAGRCSVNGKSQSRFFFAGLMPISTDALRPDVQEMLATLKDFMSENVFPNERIFEEHQHSENCWTPHPLLDELKVET